MSDIFVSYRREDSAPYAGRIFDRLSAFFGADHVFMDVEDIRAGTDFPHAIEKTVGACDVLIAVIGPRWFETLRARDAGGTDFLEQEIGAALRRNIPVIPVLVEGAAMPPASELPDTLAPLARRQALAVRDTSFDVDASELIRAVRRVTGDESRSVTRRLFLIIAAGILIAVVGSVLLLRQSRRGGSLNGVWIARMQRGTQPPYNIRLRFHVKDRSLTGEVDYPTGSGRIEGGTFDGKSIAFATRHVPQFETEPATIVFSGEVRNRAVELTATTPDGGIAKGIARPAD